jgi:cyclic pyranopterin phosphate synthase
MSHNFCESCNRVRLTATGQLYMCLGQDDMVDLRAVLRGDAPDALDAALDRAMQLKPKGHDFILDRAHTGPALSRHMSVTGG